MGVCLILYFFPWYSCNCLHDKSHKNETHCGHFGRNEISFWMIKCYVNTTRNEITRQEHLHMRLFFKTLMIVVCWESHSSRTAPETKFHFILPTIKSNKKRISFMVSLNSILSRFHFGSHTNTLQKVFSLSQQKVFL